MTRRSAVFTLVCLLPGAPAAPPAPAEEAAFFFIQLSDTQFGMYSKDREFSQETANYEFAIAAANRLKPRFVIVCGDLVNKPDDAAQVAEYQRISGKLDRSIRLYHVAGNHDVGNVPTPADLAAYRRQFGEDYYSFREGGVYGLVLNSSLIHSPSAAPEEYEKQNVWVRRELARARDSGVRQIIVFMHHPLFLDTGGEPDQYFNIPLERREPLLALFKEYGVRHVFAGHYHRNALGRDGDLHMITTGPVGMPLGKAKSGMRLVRIEGLALTHEYFDFGSIPHTLPSRPLSPPPAQ